VDDIVRSTELLELMSLRRPYRGKGGPVIGENLLGGAVLCNESFPNRGHHLGFSCFNDLDGQREPRVIVNDHKDIHRLVDKLKRACQIHMPQQIRCTFSIPAIVDAVGLPSGVISPRWQTVLSEQSMNRSMRNLGNSLIHKFGSDSYRAPATKCPQQDHKRNNLKRDLRLATAFGADVVESSPFAMASIVLLPSSDLSHADPES